MKSYLISLLVSLTVELVLIIGFAKLDFLTASSFSVRQRSTASANIEVSNMHCIGRTRRPMSEDMFDKDR